MKVFLVKIGFHEFEFLQVQDKKKRQLFQNNVLSQFSREFSDEFSDKFYDEFSDEFSEIQTQDTKSGPGQTRRKVGAP